MKKYNLIKTSIATIPFYAKISTSFRNINKFFSQFEEYNNISKTLNPLRSVALSKDYKQLIITGNDIDNLNDPFNLIGILQAIFRFIGIHSIKQNICLLF